MKSLAVLLGVVLAVASVLAEVPQTFVYQGRLTDASGAPVADGAYLIQFRLYDQASGGTVLWDNAYRTVIVTDGLFTYNLGDSVPLPISLFEDTALYLGIKVGAEPEGGQRVKLGSVAYAYHALRADTANAVSGDPFVNEVGDTMNGNLYLVDPTGGQKVGKLELLESYNSANLYLYDRDVSSAPTAALYGDMYGELDLLDSDGDASAVLKATPVDGGRLELCTPTGDAAIRLHAGSTGDASVRVPANAMNEEELLNEPGIAATFNYDQIYLEDTATIVDSIEITTPTDGYIYMTATGYLRVAHTSGSGDCVLRAWLNTSASVDFDNFIIWKVESSQATDQFYYADFCISAVKSVSAGTFKYYLAGDATETASMNRSHLTAMFFPTAYGTVEVTKSSGRRTTNGDGSDQPAPEKYDARATVETARAAQLEQQRQEIEAQMRESERTESKEQ